MFTTTKFMEDEVLFQFYASSARLKDTTFVTSLQFPKLYDPCEDPNLFDYCLAQGAVAHWHDQGIGAERELDDSESMLLQLTGRSEQSDSHHEPNILFDVLKITLGKEYGRLDSLERAESKRGTLSKILQ